jgi:hypothetical protein
MVRSPVLTYAALKAAGAFLTSKELWSDCWPIGHGGSVISLNLIRKHPCRKSLPSAGPLRLGTAPVGRAVKQLDRAALALDSSAGSQLPSSGA